MSKIIGYNPDADHLFDPQQKPDNRLRCGCCRRQIFLGEVYYLMFILSNDMPICSDCFSDLQGTASLMEE